MIKSGEYEDVYAYLFGVPRTKRNLLSIREYTIYADSVILSRSF